MTPINSKPLNDKEFLEVIDRTPLVSIDLVVRDSKNRVLMGKRTNEPAKGKWFVPGGRIYKSEDLDSAFTRICQDEIGLVYSRDKARLIGVFTHMYDNNVFNEEGISTHYVVVAYEIRLADRPILENRDQHSNYRWFDVDSADPDIHPNSIEYLKSGEKA